MHERTGFSFSFVCVLFPSTSKSENVLDMTHSGSKTGECMCVCEWACMRVSGKAPCYLHCDAHSSFFTLYGMLLSFTMRFMLMTPGEILSKGKKTAFCLFVFVTSFDDKTCMKVKRAL